MEVVNETSEVVESSDSMKESVSAADALKEQGNAAFKEKDYDTAIKRFTEAIEVDDKNHICYTNRSLCYFSLGQWGKSAQDASIAVKLSPKYVKAHFRLLKALFELSRFKEARLHLANAIKDCGETKELKALEEELFIRTGIALRPKSTDFEIVEELGDGNFSKVYKAEHKKNKKIFAIKTIERATIERMKRRHGNINNEILMEKRALHKLDHPGVVTLYCTFQDYGTLYYQMEFIGGKDLWTLLQENLDSNQAQVGCHWTLARFFLAEAISALEHMHRKGIVHRDVKPENMIIGVDGHMKFIDYGTAKDLIQTDLNGPDFVGTSEYMTPSTINNKPGGIEIDLWALGVVLFQMVLGFVPFGAASPYLIFLRIKRAHLRIPGWVPESLAAMIRLLLVKDGVQRLSNATGDNRKYETAEQLAGVCYDALRGQPLFTEWSSFYTPEEVAAINALGASLPEELHKLTNNECLALPTEVDHLNTVEGVRSVYSRPAVVGAPMHEVLVRVLGRACLVLAEETSNNGGVKPDTPWMQTFSLSGLSFRQKHHIAHYLNRRQRLHSPPVFRLFHDSAVDARSLRADPLTWEYVGFNRQIQGQWNKDFVYVHLSNPCFTNTVAAVASSADEPSASSVKTNNNAQQLRDTIAAVNKMRPKFVVVSGNLTSLSVLDAVEADSFASQVEDFRKTMARLSDTIPVMYVPGANDVGRTPTPESLQAYRKRFGADWYGVWYGGVRYLMINSCLMIHREGAPEEAALQDLWLWEEIEQCKLCSTGVVVFSYHTWFHSSMDEEDDTETAFPRELRQKWLKKLRHHKVHLVISSHFGKTPGNAKKLRPFVVDLKEIEAKRLQEEAEAEAEEERRLKNAKPNTGYKISYSDGEEPPKPSEVIREAVESGELTPEDVTPVEETAVGLDDVKVTVEASTSASTEGAAPMEVDPNAEDSSDDENDYQKEGEESSNKKKRDETSEEEDFSNEELDYEGPELVQTQPINAQTPQGEPAGTVRLILAHEVGMKSVTLAVAALPKTLTEVMPLFK